MTIYRILSVETESPSEGRFGGLLAVCVAGQL